MDKPKKPRGRPRQYEAGTSQDNEGAPKLNIRFNPLLYQHIQAQPQGPRQYLEGLVTEDMERTGIGEQLVRDDRDRASKWQGNLPPTPEDDVGLTAQQEQAAEA